MVLVSVRLLFLTVLLFVAGFAKAQDDDKKKHHSILLNINGEEVEVKALLLDSGRISLFKVIDYYIRVSTGSQPVAIQLIQENDHFKNQLKELMSDCPAIAKRISKIKFTKDDLTKLAQLYNNCASLDKRKLYSPTFNATLGIGLSFISGSIKSSEGYTEKLDWSFKPAATFYLSVGLTPPRNKNISLGLEASFSKRMVEGYSRKENGTETYETLVDIHCPQISTGLRFAQYSKKQKQIQSFYSVSAGAVFVSDAKTELWNIDSYGPFVSAIKNPSEIEAKNSTYFSFTIGARKQFETNYNVGFELRFDLQSNAIQGDGISKSMLFYVTPTLRLGLK